MTHRRTGAWAAHMGLLGVACGCACGWVACATAAQHPRPRAAAVADASDSEATDGAATDDLSQPGTLSQPAPEGHAQQGAATPRPAADGHPAHALGAPSKISPRKPTRVVYVTAQETDQAKKLLDKGLLAFQKGDYDAAEAALTQSMALYPFLAEAHFTLGKIYLMRGSANRDPSMIDHARLMFQMAHAVDPSLRETDLLLQLFLAEPMP